MRARLVIALSTFTLMGAASVARAQDQTPDGGAPEASPDGGTTPEQDAEERKRLEDELGGALAKDAAENKDKGIAVAASGSGALPGSIANPEMAVIFDISGGWYRNGPVVSGDDPGDTGVNLQEVEITLIGDVDPYFRGALFLAIPNAEGLEVEEGYLVATDLPWNLELKAGIFRSALGRQNGQHLHTQDFTRRPALNALMLGGDGLRAPGAQLSLLIPSAWVTFLTMEVLSMGAPEEDGGPIQSFGGGERKDLTYTASAETFIPFSESASLLVGLNGAVGKSPGADLAMAEDDLRTVLLGGDLYFKWKPVNQAKTYAQLAWQTEFFARLYPGQDSDNLEGVGYTQLVAQVARRWKIGARGEIAGLPTGSGIPVRTYGAGLALTFMPSEFSRVRLHVDHTFNPGEGLDNDATAAFLQLEGTFGAHAAHAF